MCDHEDSPGAPLTFARLVSLLQQPPFEPCDSELKYLTPAEYDESFTEAVRLYYRKIRRHLVRITEECDSTDDLTQEVFVNVYRARSSFEKAYIYRAATNTAINYLRHRSRQHRVLYAHWKNIRLGVNAKSEVPDPRPLPDAKLVERAREEALGRAVERLPEPFRTPLLLLAEGNSYARIVEVTQTVEGTVKSRICRGKSILRRRLRAYL